NAVQGSTSPNRYRASTAVNRLSFLNLASSSISADLIFAIQPGSSRSVPLGGRNNLGKSGRSFLCPRYSRTLRVARRINGPNCFQILSDGRYGMFGHALFPMNDERLAVAHRAEALLHQQRQYITHHLWCRPMFKPQGLTRGVGNKRLSI